jgi:nucleoside-diphosphate-sugar epimerase
MWKKVDEICGCNTFGRILSKLAESEDNEVFAFDVPSSLETLKGVFGLNVTVTCDDYSNKETLTRLLTGADVVIYANTVPSFRSRSVGRCLTELEHLLPAVSAAEVQYFLLISSCDVYSQQDQETLSENSPVYPIRQREQPLTPPSVSYLRTGSYHGHLMIECEGLVQRELIPEKCCMLRCGDVYGPSAPVWVNALLSQVAANRLWLPEGSLPAIANLCHVTTLAEVTNLVVQKQLIGTYNLVDETPMPVDYYLQLLTEAAGLKGISLWGMPAGILSQYMSVKRMLTLASEEDEHLQAVLISGGTVSASLLRHYLPEWSSHVQCEPSITQAGQFFHQQKDRVVVYPEANTQPL